MNTYRTKVRYSWAVAILLTDEQYSKLQKLPYDLVGAYIEQLHNEIKGRVVDLVKSEEHVPQQLLAA